MIQNKQLNTINCATAPIANGLYERVLFKSTHDIFTRTRIGLFTCPGGLMFHGFVVSIELFLMVLKLYVAHQCSGEIRVL